MPKFYISSGDFQHVIDRPDHLTAVLDAFESIKGNNMQSLGLVTLVSEKGFSGESEDDRFFDTTNILEQTDQLGDFKHVDWEED